MWSVKLSFCPEVRNGVVAAYEAVPGPGYPSLRTLRLHS